MQRVSRRNWIKGFVAAAAFGLGFASFASAADQGAKKVLFLTKSSGFQHSVIARKTPDQMAHLEKILIEVGPSKGYEFTCTKDASLFNDPETYKKYDVFMYYTTGDLTKDSKDGGKGMSTEGKALMMKAIEEGKGVVGVHSAPDTFHSKKRFPVRPAQVDPADVDPFIQMIGGEFQGHGSQQNATMKFVSPKFPGLENLKSFDLVDEWYVNNNVAPDLHVILVQDTESMVHTKDGKREKMYERPSYPATFARMHGKGRVYYTSMGHREDVCLNPIFQQVLFAGVDWAAGKTQFDPKPNMNEVCPQEAK